jgi:hypothetical protein
MGVRLSRDSLKILAYFVEYNNKKLNILFKI